MADNPKVCFKIPLTGGRVAVVPVSVLDQYVVEAASCAHAEPLPAAPPASADEARAAREPRAAAPHVLAWPGGCAEVQRSAAGITINIHTSGPGRPDVTAESPDSLRAGPVVAHSLSYDAHTGASDWHTDFELGDCVVVDPATGFLQTFQNVWHNHPLGTEYAELYLG